MSWTIHDDYLPSTAYGACFKCRSSKRPGERVLDPNLITDDLPPWIVPGGKDGYVMFCESCIGEAANGLGWISPLKAAEMIAEMADYQVELERAYAELRAAEDVAAAHQRYDEAKASAKNLTQTKAAPRGR